MALNQGTFPADLKPGVCAPDSATPEDIQHIEKTWATFTKILILRNILLSHGLSKQQH